MNITLRQILPGFTPFTTRKNSVHALGYVTGVIVWLGSYVLFTRIVTGTANVVVGTASMVAAAVTCIYFAVLFAAEVGSPLGDIVAPGLVTIGLPGNVYRILAPPSVPNISTVTPLNATGGAAIGAVVVSTIAPICAVTIVYVLKDDSKGWEEKTMAHSFSLLRIVGFSGNNSRTGTDDEAFDDVSFESLVGIFVGLVFLLSVVLAFLPPSLAIQPADVAGTLVATTVISYILINGFVKIVY